MPGTAVTVEELKDAILHMVVERFGDRTLDWQTFERATALANFEVKQAALFGGTR